MTLSLATISDFLPEGFGPPILPLKSPDRIKWEYILSVYDRTGGNLSATARLLGMHRRTLQRVLSTRWPWVSPLCVRQPVAL